MLYTLIHWGKEITQSYMYMAVTHTLVSFLKLFHFTLGYTGGFIIIYKKDLLGILFFKDFFKLRFSYVSFIIYMYINKASSLRKLTPRNIVVFMKSSMPVSDGAANK